MFARRRSIAVGAAVLAAGAATVPALAIGHGAPRTETENHRAAVQDAGRLLSKVNLPPTAASSPTEPAGDGGRLSGPPSTPGVSKFVDRHQWWTASGSPDQVLNYVRSHPPPHGKLSFSGAAAQCQPGQAPSGCHTTSQFVAFQFPPAPGMLGLRLLLVEVTALGDSTTGVRTDGQVQWIVPRAADEVVPSDVTLIEVRKGDRLHRVVTDRSEVRQIIRLIDRLPVLQPGSWHCPAFRSGPQVRFAFRGERGGPALARASVRSDVGNSDTGCDAMSFSIGGKAQPGLVQARHFLRAVGRLLGVRLTTSSGR
jgi:hypothetical protein